MPDPFAAFDVGRRLGTGQSALGELVKTVTARASALQQAQLEAGFDPKRLAEREAYQQVTTATTDPAERIKLFQQSGLLSRPQKSLEEIHAESEARASGVRAGAPRPINSRQEDAIEGLQSTLATLNEMRTFLDTNPDVQTGLLQPAFRRDLVGDIARSVSNPKLTQFSQVSFRMQDAYRRFITGVQAGFPEVARFLPSSIPNPATQNPEQLRAGMETLALETRRAQEQIKRSLRMRGYSEEQIEQWFLALPTFQELEQEVGTSPSNVESVKARLRAKYGTQ